MILPIELKISVLTLSSSGHACVKSKNKYANGLSLVASL